MMVQVIKHFVRRGVSQLPGSIITIPEEMLPKMAGYIQSMTDATCYARKVGGRICGASLREGINGHWSCSDKHCQVPAVPALIRS